MCFGYIPRAPGIPGNNDPQKFPREFPGIFEKISHRPREIPGIMVTNISRGNCRELSKNYITGTQNSLKYLTEFPREQSPLEL